VTPAASKQSATPSISAILAAFNEEGLIAETVLQVGAVLSGLTDDFEIVVTNDGSRDRTGEVLASLAERRPDLQLRVITHERNQGYGAALASGFDAADKDLIFLTDGDRQFDVSELAAFVDELDDSTDLVIGWRRDRADAPMRLLNAWFWKQLITILFGYTARDVDCAFKLLRRTVWNALRVQSRGATFSAELLIKARRNGFRVKERPVRHFARTTGIPTGAKPRVIVRAVTELIRLRWNLRHECDVAKRDGSSRGESSAGGTAAAVASAAGANKDGRD
jgi:glycosyltransferase involved in cell wall biosynthesis